ncbi:ferritin-like domain-containing protein [Angelakisella massiliensis]|uniref:ferritin-like domain-containing protein n=1 Tax=Angelakisella massiliensis TaxID=1871018 RepID=UPI0008F84415|nr:manganese catalase family protein [Angelakisella massiliensis]
MDLSRYQAEGPYPEMENRCPNPKALTMLYPLYAGAASELSAIHQYTYQRLLCCPDEVTETLGGIAAVEMHHLMMLGRLIRSFGGDPRFCQPSRRRWWDGGMVCYENRLCKLLLKDLSDEHNAVTAYLYTAQRIGHPCAAALLRRIAKDEEHHIILLTKLINQFCRKG